MKLIHDDLGFGKTRVLMLDDQVSVREMAAAMVTSEGLCAVVGQASSGVEGLRMFRKLRPGAVILALALPEMSGAEVLLAMREENPRLPVLVYSGTKSQDLWRAGLKAGPQGVVHKTESMATLREGVTAVVSGQTFFGRFATTKMEEMRIGGEAEEGLAPRAAHGSSDDCRGAEHEAGRDAAVAIAEDGGALSHEVDAKNRRERCGLAHALCPALRAGGLT